MRCRTDLPSSFFSAICIVVLVAISFALHGCGGGAWCAHVGFGSKSSQKMNDLGPYTKVEVESGINAVVQASGTAGSVEITSFDNVADGLSVSVLTGSQAGTLRLAAKDGYCNLGADAKVVLLTPLEGFTVNGGSSGTASLVEGSIAARGGSHVTVGLLGDPKGENPTASILASGGSSVSVNAGQLKSLSMSLTGGSSAKLGNVKSGKVIVSLSGGSSAESISTQDLDIQSHGGSTISAYVAGDGSVSGSCHGGGSITIYGGANVGNFKKNDCQLNTYQSFQVAIM